MSVIYLGKEIFKPLNTGRIDDRVACIREWIGNIFFYTKNGTTIMIDAGYNYDRLAEKMKWLDIDPAGIEHILLTHQDTDHIGAVERNVDGLFRKATLYLSEIENRYMTGEARRRVLFKLYRLPLVVSDNPRVLLKNGEVLHFGEIKVEAILVPGHTWGHMVYLSDMAEPHVYIRKHCGRNACWLCRRPDGSESGMDTSSCTHYRYYCFRSHLKRNG